MNNNGGCTLNEGDNNFKLAKTAKSSKSVKLSRAVHKLKRCSSPEAVSKHIIKCLSTEVLFIHVTIYFGGLHQSKALYKFGFFEGIFEGFQNKAECNTYK